MALVLTRYNCLTTDPLWVGRGQWAVWADLDWLNQMMLGRIYVIWALQLLKDLIPTNDTVICKMTWVGIFVKMYTCPVVVGGLQYRLSRFNYTISVNFSAAVVPINNYILQRSKVTKKVKGPHGYTCGHNHALV